jgi:hypothetical protein
MSDASPAAHTFPATKKKGVVFLGDKFIELDDPAAVTLGDLCDSFGTPWESGMHVRQRSTGRVVATLPFEPLPPLTEVADITLKLESAAAATPPAQVDTTVGERSRLDSVGDLDKKASREADAMYTNEEDMEEGDDEEEYAVVYVLVNSNAPQMDETTAALSGPLAANIRGIPGIEETMRQLVELGAAELLTAEPASVVHSKREYHPSAAPGLLRRIVYPASQYSPYRTERDPVIDGKHALFRSTPTGTSSPASAAVASYKAVATFEGEGGPYTSYLDSYALSERVEVPRAPAPNASKASLVVALTSEEQQRIFGG